LYKHVNYLKQHRLTLLSSSSKGHVMFLVHMERKNEGIKVRPHFSLINAPRTSDDYWKIAYSA